MRNYMAAMIGIVSALAALSSVQAGRPDFHGSELGSQAKIPMALARSKALKARPGSIMKEELEKEKGGSGLRYSFDIRNGAKTYEVGIDAKDGKILENGAEGGD